MLINLCTYFSLIYRVYNFHITKGYDIIIYLHEKQLKIYLIIFFLFLFLEFFMLLGYKSPLALWPICEDFLGTTASGRLVFCECGCVSGCALLFLGQVVFQAPRQHTLRRQKHALHKILLQKLLQNWNYKANAMVHGCIIIKIAHHVEISIS